MHLELTEEQTMMRDTCRSFAREELLPKAAEIDERGEFPKEQVQRMAEIGLMGVAVSADYEGAGMDNVSYALAMEEISAGCASCGVIMSVNNSLVCDPIAKFGSAEQKKQWLPDLASGRKLGCFALSEPGTGSDAAAQTTVAVKDGHEWVINGSKNFITNGNDADMCIVFAMGDKSKGVKGINAYLVPADTKGYSVAKNEKKLGIKGSSTSQINLDDVRLPASAMLGTEGLGFKVAMTTLDGGRIGIAAQALGIARQALEEARDYSLERQAFGGPISDLQAIQFMLADMAIEVDAARLLIWRAAALKDKGARFTTESAMAKLYASEMSNRVTNKALQIFGGYGYCKDYPAERHLRDARITEIYEGTSEVQRLVIARSVLTGGR
ncbi:MAG: acyl-CoA dehydrogenase [Deltaproteobacteria bacterium RIFOXYA12_FULL_58_15]|nr:MAG: acyl-CoA dehydrogenase [Deltaproteobacteria bacterium RIFOXYA12_FULL_58_15]OGR09110.1 MAG: acyl-CoA dehydrogenase [Deltaproteobacteria bacterium RIFOXYB12_FULL_58_9]